MRQILFVPALAVAFAAIGVAARGGWHAAEAGAQAGMGAGGSSGATRAQPAGASAPDTSMPSPR